MPALGLYDSADWFAVSRNAITSLGLGREGTKNVRKPAESCKKPYIPQLYAHFYNILVVCIRFLSILDASGLYEQIRQCHLVLHFTKILIARKPICRYHD